MAEMDTKSLACFVTVCECGSLSKAAEKCYISRQGISQVMARLEEELSCRLIERTTSGVVPTEAGELLLYAARNVLYTMERCTNQIRNLGMDQQLNIVFAPGAYYRLSPVITLFRETYPECRVNIMERVDGECEEYVRRGQADIGFTPGPFKEDIFEAERVITVPYVVVADKNNRIMEKDLVQLRDLDGYQILVQGPQHKIYSQLTGKLTEHHIKADVSYVYDALLQFSAVENTEAVGISTERVAKIMMTDRTAHVLLDSEEMAWNLYMIRMKEHKLSYPSQRLYDMVLSQMKKNK